MLLCILHPHSLISVFFFFNDTATTEIYTLSLHDALPIFQLRQGEVRPHGRGPPDRPPRSAGGGHRRLGPDHQPHPQPSDRKSTRLNSSHGYISYAVFCLKKKKKLIPQHISITYHDHCDTD